MYLVSPVKFQNDRIRTDEKCRFHWNFCNFWNSKQKFEIPALLQGGTICLVSLVKNSEFSNKNCRRSSVFKKSGISAISGILSRNLKFRLCYRVALYA